MMETRDSENVEMMAPLMVTGPFDDEDHEVPPLESFIPKLKFCYKFFKWPLVFLAANGVVVTLIFSAAIPVMRDYYNRIDTPTATSADFKLPGLKGLFTHVILAYAILALLDSVSIMRAAWHVGRDIENEQDSSWWSTNHVYAKVSRLMDSFLGRGETPQVPFLVNFLWATAAVFLTLSSMFLVEYALFLSKSTDDTCFRLPANRRPETQDKLSPIVGIPESLQEWAQQRRVHHQELSSYAHLSDGSTFFGGRTNGSDVVLLGTSKSGTLKTYREIVYPDNFVIIQDDTGFCCEYERVYDRTGALKVFCHISGKDQNATWNLASKGEKETKNHGYSWSQVDTEMRYENGLTWLKATRYRNSGETIEIATLNATTMNITTVAVLAERKAQHGHHYSRRAYDKIVESPCFQSIAPAMVGIGTIVAGLLSVWMWSSRKLTAAIVPICLLLHLLLLLVSLDVTFCISFLGSLSMCFVLATNRARFTKIQREVVISTLYTSLLVLGCVSLFMGDSRDDSVGVMISLVVIGLVLNHPVIQILGVGVALLPLMLLFFIRDPDELMFLLFVLTPMCIVISCGLVFLGHQCSKYRPYIVVYSRQLWRTMLAATGTNESTRVGERQP
jgi:hypothetical protein